MLVLTALDACPQWRLPSVPLAVAAAALVGAGWFAAVQPALATPAGAHPPGLARATIVA